MMRTIKKEAKITRTVTFTKFNAIGVDLDTMTIKSELVILNDDWSDKELEEYRKENGYAKISDVEKYSTVMECTLSEFLSIAKVSNRRVAD